MSTPRQTISTGSAYEKAFGYARAVRAGDMVFVAGTVGLDYASGMLPEGPAAQFRQSVANIARALEEAGATLADVVRIVTYVDEAATMEAIREDMQRLFSPVMPANTALVVGFPFPGIKVEIEATAVAGSGSGSGS